MLDAVAGAGSCWDAGMLDAGCSGLGAEELEAGWSRLGCSCPAAAAVPLQQPAAGRSSQARGRQQPGSRACSAAPTGRQQPGSRACSAGPTGLQQPGSRACSAAPTGRRPPVPCRRALGPAAHRRPPARPAAPQAKQASLTVEPSQEVQAAADLIIKEVIQQTYTTTWDEEVRARACARRLPAAHARPSCWGCRSSLQQPACSARRRRAAQLRRPYPFRNEPVHPPTPCPTRCWTRSWSTWTCG
jgi:hypothetical protein